MEKEKDNIIDNTYTILSKLDSGGYGVVYIVTDNQENNGKQYAAKIYKYLTGVDREIEILKILKDLHNPFLINFINEGKGLIKYKGKIFKDKKYCILELASKYNLFKFIESTGKFEETHCKVIFQKILKAIKAMHSKDIYHLDIKLENILLDEKFEPKITDFGLSKKKEETKNGFLEGYMGTKNYMPPQMFLFQKFNPIQADIFSLGVVLFTLSAGVNGFTMATASDSYYKYIKRNTEKSIDKYWEKVEGNNIKLSGLLKKLYIRMVSFNEDNRPSIDKILEDEWFEEIDKLNNEERNKLEQEIYSEFKKRKKKVN